MNTATRQAPLPRDAVCPVCTGLMAAHTETATVIDLLAPGRIPTQLAAMHPLCYRALSTSYQAVLAARKTPRGPTLDKRGAIVYRAENVIFRVTGPNRLIVAKALRVALAEAATRQRQNPIVAFVRPRLTSVGGLIARMSETPGKPPDQRKPSDPAMTLTIECNDKDPASAFIAQHFRFASQNSPGSKHSYDSRWISTLKSVQAHLEPYAKQLYGTLPDAQIIQALYTHAKAHPSVANVHASYTDKGCHTIVVDLNAWCPDSEAAPTISNIVSTPPPTGSYTGSKATMGSIASTTMAPKATMSTVDDNGIDDNGDGDNSAVGGGCGEPVADRFSATPVMLEPLDSADDMRQWPTLAAHCRELLTGRYTNIKAMKATIDRDPDTLSLRLTLDLSRRVHTPPTKELASTFLTCLRMDPVWKRAENDDGAEATIRVIDGAPPDAPDGSEGPDEINLRGLPKSPTTAGTSSQIGKRVAFRETLWRAMFGAPIFDGSNLATPLAQTVELSPYAGELGRIRKKFMHLLGDSEPQATIGTPEWARVSGVLEGYDAITDHAVVRLSWPKVGADPATVQGDIYIHTTLGWTTAYNP